MKIPRFSIISACYNSAPYIDEFLESLFSQSSGYRSLEIILVDDGSNDGTAQKIAVWSGRYPGIIKYIWQPNAGQAAARNAGLKLATGDWVSFMDPDDFIADNYIEECAREIARHKDQSLAFISCALIFYFEDQRTFSDSHPLNFKYRSSRAEFLVRNINNRIQLHTSAAWMRLGALRALKLRFDPRIKPTFEDAALCNRYLLAHLDKKIVYLPAHYYYRKRRSRDSSVDTSAASSRHYTDEIEFGHLALLRHAKKKLGRVPRFIQNTVIYHLLYRIQALRASGRPQLDEAVSGKFLRLLKSAFQLIEPEAIREFNIQIASAEDRIGLLGMLKNMPSSDTAVRLEQIDAPKGWYQFSHQSYEAHCRVQAHCNGQATALAHHSRVATHFLGQPFCYRHYFWVQLPPGAAVHFTAEGNMLNVQAGGKLHPPIVRAGKLARAHAQPTRWTFSGLNAKDREIRRFCTDPVQAAKYADSWLMVDRRDHAGDNAEHFYRHAVARRPAGSCFFALQRSSRDWQRLEREGFNLIDIDSPDYLSALSNCRVFISSHAHRLDARIEDIAKCGYVFLQHGITKDDSSAWMNAYRFSLFCTSSPAEAASIADPGSNYRFSGREVVLTGMPRHDRLCRARRSRADTLLIMPTWRFWLKGLDEKNLRKSQFFQRWHTLLHDPGLKAMARREKLRLLFMLHPGASNLASLLEPAGRAYELADTSRFQQELARARVLLTDYSSVDGEMALLDKPVVYYQFDAARFSSGAHVNRKPGYFKYATHGFGPVARTQAAALDHLSKALKGHEPSCYSQRRREAFPYRDGRCCARVYEAIIGAFC